ncbi:phospholipase D-like domain-containing protein [Hypericibacter sp.]|uniref:phospholipase D-like domain-containing protein n=1 Tax=Hypericibacter sp. TaxID=2705401 RepID=UPI003D6CB7EE
MTSAAAAIDTTSYIPFVATGSYPVRTGNRLRPLVDGVPAFRRIGEAVEAARRRVWVTVTFIAPDFRLPDGRGSFFDLLDRAVARGLDVRVIFWRPNPESSDYGRVFAGAPADRDMLRARGSRFLARWDRAPGGFCQHQKSWLIDAGEPTETAFVGGINLTGKAIGAPGHEGEGGRHDLYLELGGPSATDIHHNFVQRWNEASERQAEDGRWGHGEADALPFPALISAPQGGSRVQIQRNLHPGCYRDGHAAPGGKVYDIAGGERTIFEQYRQAIDAARDTIYVENQAVPTPAVAANFEAALKRGVDIVMLVPADPEERVREARRNPEWKPFFEQLAVFRRYGNFMLAGIAARDNQGGRSNIYVHGKAMLIDDRWATVGSCNLHWNSMNGNAEMNASFWDPPVVRALRCQLLAEHLGRDTVAFDDRAALHLYRQIAQDNRRRRDAGDLDWQGLAFRLDPAAYGE